MIYFEFIISDSFLKYSTHPITIPKTQVDYKEVEKGGFAQGDLTIIFPKGEKIRGHVYFGIAGYGPYYQIRSYPNQNLPKYLAQGDKVIILLYKDKSHLYSSIEYRN